MKVGTVTKTNNKGQIVIPQKMRDELNIDSESLLNIVLRGGALYIYPIDEVIPRVSSDNSYFEILKKTKGAWGKGDWVKTEKSREKIELEASKKRKSSW